MRAALENIRAILQKSVGRQLRPIECHDIVCFTAEAVLAGGIRRSSLISLFSPDDGEMMRCKAPENFRPSFGKNDPGLNNQRQLANNSAVFVRGNIDKQNFETKAFLVGVKKTAFGKTFTSQGRKFKITGLNTRAKKYPIQASTVGGKRYKFNVSQLPANLRS